MNYKEFVGKWNYRAKEHRFQIFLFGYSYSVFDESFYRGNLSIEKRYQIMLYQPEKGFSYDGETIGFSNTVSEAKRIICDNYKSKFFDRYNKDIGRRYNGL
jgi:hypothetical protein